MENHSEILKCSKVKLLISLLLIVISIALFGYSSKLDQKAKVEPVAKDYNELIAYEKDVENEYVEVTITNIPYGFAEDDDDGITRSYYFVYDQYDYMYIVRLMDSTYTMLENKYNENPEEFSYTLKGYIFENSKELKELAIRAYNKARKEEIVNQENFRSYFGNTYLDEALTPYDDTSVTLVAFGVVIDTIAFLIFIVYITEFTRTNKTLKKYDREDIEYELSKTSTIEYKKAKVYLTDKYIISKFMGLNILEYNETIWLYNEKRRQNLIPVGTYLIAFDNKKAYQIASVSPSKKGENLLSEIILKIREKNSTIMIGYTKENVDKYYKKIYNKI